MISLPHVTLLAVDNVAPELMTVAIEDCRREVLFDHAVLFSDCAKAPDGTRVIYSGPRSRVDATLEYWTGANRIVQTSHFLVIQWDSWIIRPDCWSDEFLEYDYIGAPWRYRDGRNVGNGGFSLRSMNLVAAVLHEPEIINEIKNGKHNEDEIIGRRYRKLLEVAHGIRFAPEGVAFRFSRERTGWDRPEASFGFHGIFNWYRVLDTAGLIKRSLLINDYVRSRPEYKGFVHDYYRLGGRYCGGLPLSLGHWRFLRGLRLWLDRRWPSASFKHTSTSSLTRRC
jgi:hypothetical protein